MKQSDKDAIIDSANEREFYLKIGNKKYMARLAGKKCDYPMAWTRNELGQDIDVEISWALASRISTGELNTITA